MKRDPEKDRDWRRRSKPLKAKKRIRPVNPERKQRRMEKGEVYGPYHAWMKSLPCYFGKFHDHRCQFFSDRPGIEGHHLKSVGAGGKDYANELPCCPGAHDALEGKVPGITRKDIEERRNVDLDEVAQRLARSYDARLYPHWLHPPGKPHWTRRTGPRLTDDDLL